MFILFSIFAVIHQAPSVRYSSSIQIKNAYSKNRLTVTTETSSIQYQQPTIYSTRPPFDDGWTWVIEPEEDNITLARTPVKCGSNITMINPIAKLYVSTTLNSDKVDVVPSSRVQGKESVWTVVCESGDVWVRDHQIQLLNAKYNCYLSTSLALRTKELVNRYNVTCSSLSADAVWKAAEGIYFLDPKAQEKKNDDYDSPKEDL